MISQCLDSKFLEEVFSDQGKNGLSFLFSKAFNNLYFLDEYFVSNIEKVDSVTLLRKDKVMSGVRWTLRFQHALCTWPMFNELGGDISQVFASVYKHGFRVRTFIFNSFCRNQNVVLVKTLGLQLHCNYLVNRTIPTL